MKSTLGVYLWIYALLFCLTRADNPVVCTLKDSAGKWDFYFDDMPVKKGDKNYERMSCGRCEPTKLVNFGPDPDAQERLLAGIQGVDGATKFSCKSNPYDLEEVLANNIGIKPVTRHTVLDLSHDDDKLTQYDPSDLTKSIGEGTWTGILHEGFIGFLDDHSSDKAQNIVFNGFWRYNTIDEEKQKYKSVCEETMIGWYHTNNPDNEDDEDWGCFYAKKILGKGEKPKEHVNFEGGKPKFPSSGKTEDCKAKVDEEAEEGTLHWKTDLSMASVKNVAMSAPKLDKAKNGATKEPSHENEGKLQKAGDLYWTFGKDPDDISEEELEIGYFNWNDINGYSFYPKIKQQGCGDCFLVATLSVVESRIMIRSNGKLKPELSNQHIKDCNPYTEACDGGLPMNVAKYAWEYGFIDSECYKSGPEDHQCNHELIDSGKCDEYRVKDFYYVGGNYGGISEKLLMQELLANGPTTVVINAPGYLPAYKGCILEQLCDGPEEETAKYINTRKDPEHNSRLQAAKKHKISEETLWDKGVEWNMVNHSVTLVGFGIDDTCANVENAEGLSRRIMVDGMSTNEECNERGFDGAYWIIANSWGENFGEQGFFRIRRGCNDFGIESQALSIVPNLSEDDLDCRFKEEKCTE